MKTLLWLDDIRDPKTGIWLRTYAPTLTSQDRIVWVKNYDEFTSWIEKNGLPDHVAFDHDLGDDVARDKVSKGMSKRQARKEKKETLSGYECAKWLSDYCIKNNLTLPYYTIHSANPVGADNINKYLTNHIKFFDK